MFDFNKYIEKVVIEKVLEEKISLPKNRYVSFQRSLTDYDFPRICILNSRGNIADDMNKILKPYNFLYKFRNGPYTVSSEFIKEHITGVKLTRKQIRQIIEYFIEHKTRFSSINTLSIDTLTRRHKKLKLENQDTTLCFKLVINCFADEIDLRQLLYHYGLTIIKVVDDLDYNHITRRFIWAEITNPEATLALMQLENT